MDPWSWLGYAKTNFHSAERTVEVPLSNAGKTSLKDLCSSPSVTPPCRLTPLLPSGHLQTMYSIATKADVPINYRRKVFDSNDPNYPGTFVVDFVSHVDAEPGARSLGDADEGKRIPSPAYGNQYCPKRTRLFNDDEWAKLEEGSNDSTPMLIALHGLSGGSYEVYLKEVLAPLVLNNKQGEQRWEACVVNARGCAGSAITTGLIFNARATWDYRQTVNWLRQKYPNRPLFGVGFSLGGNILVDYMAEEGDQCPLDAAVSVSNPWDLAASNISLQKTYVGKEVYQRAMGSNLKRLFMKQVEVAKQNPNVDVEKVMASKYLYEFDRALQCPSWGYPTEGAYYRDSASIEPVMDVRVPLLGINAEDDPLAPPESLPYGEVKSNPYAVLCTTTMGGHLGWFESDGSRWFAKPATNFLRRMAEDVDLDTLRKQRISRRLPAETQMSQFNSVRRKLTYRSEWKLAN